jgi:futalosine hydrolase
MLASAVSLTRMLIEDKPDLVIQAGIAGCFDQKMPLGKLVVVADEMLADMGVEEDGKWKDIFDLKLEKSSYPPFERRKLANPWVDRFNLLKLPAVTGVTVNTITTGKEKIHQLVKKYDPVIESMEGAALHYACLQAGTPFLQVRALSNYIGERDKSNWLLKESITNLNQALVKLVDKLYKLQ